MQLLQMLLKIFLWPGDYVRRAIGMTLAEDGGMLRSFINMIVWGILVVIVVFNTVV